MRTFAYYSYLSSRVGADPVKTIFLFAPEEDAVSRERLALFADRTGWTEAAERDAALLVAPVAEEGWDAFTSIEALELFRSLRGAFRARPGKGIPGTGDAVWTWEVLIYLVGYGAGAGVAGNVLLSCPGFAAAAVLVDGRGSDLVALDAPSAHWLVPEAQGYAARNRDIPVAVWLMGSVGAGNVELGAGHGSEVADVMLTALVDAGGLTAERTYELEGHGVVEYASPVNPAARVLASPGLTGEDSAIVRLAMEHLFNVTLRWKNGPDGTLARHISHEGFLHSGEYRHLCVEAAGRMCRFALYLPHDAEGVELPAAGLPLVVSLHGRGEPAWLFCQKNGWEHLADETGAFVVMLPDSPGNIWIAERDEEALLTMVAAAVEEAGLDAERVYLTGFSNGALFTCQMATAHPERFAAASAWNSPGEGAVMRDGLGAYLYHSGFEARGYELPFWVVYGDADVKAPAVREDGFRAILRSNGCGEEPVNVWDGAHYTLEAGYEQGERFRTEVFARADGSVRAGFTVMRNMPHGAIWDEARAAWDFMRSFYRRAGAPAVSEITDADATEEACS